MEERNSYFPSYVVDVIEKSIGPRIESWGTPLVKGSG
jgi:hypothetical protein